MKTFKYILIFKDDMTSVYHYSHSEAAAINIVHRKNWILIINEDKVVKCQPFCENYSFKEMQQWLDSIEKE
jgi:hypothetical protein